jgi:hypothetical protein
MSDLDLFLFATLMPATIIVFGTLIVSTIDFIKKRKEEQERMQYKQINKKGKRNE